MLTNKLFLSLFYLIVKLYFQLSLSPLMNYTLVFQCQVSGRNEVSVGSVWSWVWNLFLVDIRQGKADGCTEIFYFASWAADSHSKGIVVCVLNLKPSHGISEGTLSRLHGRLKEPVVSESNSSGFLGPSADTLFLFWPKGQRLVLKNEASTDLPKTADPEMFTWGWLWKQASSNEAQC